MQHFIHPHGTGLQVEIVGAESLGVRSLCCIVTTPRRRVVIDPGLALGFTRHGLQPHPLQIAVGRMIRQRIIRALEDATDVVISHFHGDHVPLADANPYQLPIQRLPARVRNLRCWCKSDRDEPKKMRARFSALQELFGGRLRIAEGHSEDGLTFSEGVPHGAPGSPFGNVMMTCVEHGGHRFVHASDIQLLDDTAVDRILDWKPNTVLAAGPPLYLNRLLPDERMRAWRNAIRLLERINAVVLDHHLLRGEEGSAWLSRLSQVTGKPAYSAADFMGRPRRLLEARRRRLYSVMPVPTGWHANYAAGEVTVEGYFRQHEHPGQDASNAL